MPCWSVITNSVDMPKMHPDLVTRALAALGATAVRTSGASIEFYIPGAGEFRLVGGTLTGRSQQSEAEVAAMAARLKRGYGHQVVQATAKKRGWTLKKVGANKYAVTKR
jgi:hypothetical protein